MGKLTIGDDAETGEGTAKFYGANTLGAAAGALLGAFVIFPLLGLSRGLYVGASLDLLAAILALGLVVPKRAGDATGKEQPANPPLATTLDSNFKSTALALTFLFGASSLALEVLLTRLLITVTGASVFAFALVLTVYLLGIGIGGRRARLLLAREGGAKRLLESCAVWIPIVGFAGLIFLRYQLGESDLFGVLANRMPSGAATWLLWASQAFFAGLALFPPAYGFGLALPACTALVVESRGDWSRERAMGRLYAFNTAGATLGSLGAGFFLLPELGPRSSIAIAFLVAWLAAPLLGKATQGGLARLPFPTAAALFLGWFALRPAPSDARATTLFHSVGRDSTVSVLETAASTAGHSGARSLLVNGKVVATTAPVDLRLQRLLGTIPAHLHREPKTALVIGLGTGMTAGALLDFPSLESLEIFEISSTVREGARHFEAWNSGVLNDARTHIRIADGRHALALSPERFDIGHLRPHSPLDARLQRPLRRRTLSPDGRAPGARRDRIPVAPALPAGHRRREDDCRDLVRRLRAHLRLAERLRPRVNRFQYARPARRPAQPAFSAHRRRQPQARRYRLLARARRAAGRRPRRLARALRFEFADVRRPSAAGIPSATRLPLRLRHRNPRVGRVQPPRRSSRRVRSSSARSPRAPL